MAGTNAVRASSVLPQLAAFGAGGLKLLPLVRGELGADGQQKARVSLLQLGTSLGNFVDLGEDELLAGLIGAHERLHGELRLFDAGVHVNEIPLVFKKNRIHALALVVGQVELIHHGLIVPPPAGATGTEGSLERGTVGSEALPRALGESLRPGSEGAEQGSSRNDGKNCFESSHLVLLVAEKVKLAFHYA